MSYCKEKGKDKIIFLSKEDYSKPIDTKLAHVEEVEEPGLILPNGDINWNCPCLGGMATGPCGQEFREAFSCFHYSKEEPKGSECIDAFRTMSECMAKYPDLYPEAQDDEDDEENENNQKLDNKMDESSSTVAVKEKGS